MADKITGNAPYFRTVPSSPEPDEDEILLLGEDDIIEEEMSPAGLPEKILAHKIGGEEDTKEKSKNGEEDDEEAILRRRLLEKKKEKEEQKEGKKSSSSTNRKESPSKSADGEQEKEQQKLKDKPTTNIPAKKEREKIVWNKQEKMPSTSTKIQEEYSTSAGRKEEKREKENKLGNEKQRNVLPSSSKTSSELKVEEYKKSAELKSSSFKGKHHYRKEVDEKRDEGGAKKRHREKSDSSEGRRGERDRRKTSKKEEKEIHTTIPAAEKEAMMEEVSPLEEDEPAAEGGGNLEKTFVESTANKPKKYSKFESSPEQSEEEEGMGAKEEKDEIYSDIEQSDDGKANLEMERNDTEGDVLDDDLLENKKFDKLTETEKAILSPEKLKQMEMRHQKKLISLLPVYYPGISGCRSVAEYECLNKISEGTFGVVYRAQERRTDEIIALKRLKMEKEHQGFPITSLREINMLLKCGTHPNVLNVREVVVGSSMDKIYMVMEYVEHDMKSLMELMKSRNKKWTISQVKTLMRQLLSGVEHMHEEYVIHRDLKTSNLLISHQGILKIGDFGLAREFGEPIKPYTPIVVTLWYRSPELLLGTKIYSTAVDIWSVGCIFGEFLKLDPMFAGRTEIEQLQKIFKEVGTPNEQIWPGCMELPGMKTGVFSETPYNQLRRKFATELPDDDGYELLNKLLALDPKKRISASSALKSKWFLNDPKPTPPSSFPTWPAKSEHNKKPPNEPAAPRKPVGGFTLKFDVPKF